MGSIRDHRCTTPEWRSIKSWLLFLDWVIFTLEIIFNFAESARQGKGKVLTYFKISLTHYATLDRQLGFGGALNTVFKSSLYLCSFALKLRLNDISIVGLFVFVIFVQIFSAGIRRKHVFKSFSQSDNWHRRMSRVSLDLFNMMTDKADNQTEREKTPNQYPSWDRTGQSGSKCIYSVRSPCFIALSPEQQMRNETNVLRPWQTRTLCCGHIVAHDVSWAAQTGKHLLRTQNVSEQNQKHFLCPGHNYE